MDMAPPTDAMLHDAYARLEARSVLSGRDLRQRRVERRSRARQILERQPAIGRLFLCRGRRGANLGDGLAAIQQGQRRDHMKFVGFDRLVLQQENAERDDILATPIGNIAVDRDEPSRCMPPSFA